MIRAPALLTLFLAALFLPAGARAEPPHWIVRDADSTMLIFGSVHSLPPGEDWRPAVLMRALGEADDLWFEAPLDATEEPGLSARVAALANLPSGETLSDRLPPATAQRLTRVAAQLGVYQAALERLRPWMAEITLVLASDMRSGGRPDLGVEQQIRAQVGPRVQRRTFETLGEQIEMLAGAAEDDQLASLTETLRTLEEDPGATRRISDHWRAGDMTELEADALAPLRQASPAVYDRLITQRNRRWVRQIRERLAGSGRTVVIVGVGHLIGPQSVPDLLRAEGVTVEGP